MSFIAAKQLSLPIHTASLQQLIAFEMIRQQIGWQKASIGSDSSSPQIFCHSQIVQ